MHRKFRYIYIIPSQAFGKMHMGSYSDDDTPDRKCIECHVSKRLVTSPFKNDRQEPMKDTPEIQWDRGERKGMEGGREKGKNSWLDVSKKWVVYSYYCIWASPFLKGK